MTPPDRADVPPAGTPGRRRATRCGCAASRSATRMPRPRRRPTCLSRCAPGEVVLVLGPSGSGKSTLALSLNGLIPHALPADVTGSIAGGRPAGIRHARRRAQHPGRDGLPGPRRTALHRIGARRGRLRARESADAGGRGARAGRGGAPPRRAVGPAHGEPRPALRRAAASASRSRAPWRWDRPCSCSTSRPRTSTRSASKRSTPPSRRSWPSGDRAIVLIEHNLDAAIGLVDRVVVLDQAGRLAFDGPAHEVLRANADALVAMGVWLPTATLAALRLRDAGHPLEPAPPHAGRAAGRLEAAPFAGAAAGGPARRRCAEIRRTAPDQGDAAASGPITRTSPDPAPAARHPPAHLRARPHRHPAPRNPVLHDVDLDIARGVLPRRRRGERRGQDHPRAGDRRRPPAAPGARARRRPRPGLGVAAGAVPRASGSCSRTRSTSSSPTPSSTSSRTACGCVTRPTTEVHSRVRAMLDRFGLADKAETHPFLLSGGQKRRLSVGTALIAGRRSSPSTSRRSGRTARGPTSCSGCCAG